MSQESEQTMVLRRIRERQQERERYAVKRAAKLASEHTLCKSDPFLVRRAVSRVKNGTLNPAHAVQDAL